MLIFKFPRGRSTGTWMRISPTQHACSRYPCGYNNGDVAVLVTSPMTGCTSQERVCAWAGDVYIVTDHSTRAATLSFTAPECSGRRCFTFMVMPVYVFVCEHN
ncbi:hypothetical protein AVEN_29817-1 [Araneus ventricosus]|uniref:Uncharacterized protein n=1 Tax=Araneus ventricosus TaxID=182803 RepID=A0A4Y2JW79_ARAVE|nr:hypothetical protein AVEN_29817-1 [Araneus ventricosus]